MAIKNTILMVLIILIFHFLIKNYLIEKSVEATFHDTTTKSTGSVSDVSLQLVSKEEPIKPPAPLPLEIKDKIVVENMMNSVILDPLPSAVKKLDQHEDDLLKFVFGNDAKPSAAVSMLNDVVTIEEQTSNDPSESSGVKNFSIIKQYDNENIMNGGSIFQGIQGFELGSDANFQSIDGFLST
jgi:hypothetical protein